MAIYGDATCVQRADSNIFQVTHEPGDQPIFSGIYRCTGCGKEIAHNSDWPLPPHGSHGHEGCQRIRWRLVVLAETLSMRDASARRTLQRRRPLRDLPHGVRSVLGRESARRTMPAADRAYAAFAFRH
jgi:hypothetical protein